MASAKPAFLYVIGSAEPGPHKVGLSVWPEKRLRGIQTGNPNRLLIKRTSLSAVDNANAVETYAHWLLRESHASGEWFNVTEEAAWVALIAAQEAVANRLKPTRRRSVAGVGRPRLSATSETRPTMVRLTVAVREQIEALVGGNQMSAFIRDAVDEKIQRDLAELKRRERKPKGGEG